MELITNMHTIFMLIGPMNYGKSTFAKEILIPQLHYRDEKKGFTTNVQYISSAESRFFEKLNEVISFPINAEFVIVDSIDLSEEFREQVMKIAKTNNYNLEVVLFDLKGDILKQVSKSKFKRVHRIKEKNFYDSVRKRANPEYKVVIENLHEYMSCVLSHAYNYIIVGDVHEKVRELKQKFFRLVEVSKEFYRYIGVHLPSFYVTHAPCKGKYIGKLDNESLRKQRSFLLNREQLYEEQLGFLEMESAENHPYHIFGHVAVNEIVRFKNKINIDTGSVNGNLLTSVVFDSGKPLFKQQETLDLSQ